MLFCHQPFLSAPELRPQPSLCDGAPRPAALRRHAVPVPQRVGDALAEAGPSITLAASAETLAFALGGFTSMPAVRNFALCAALAIFLDFLLQARCNRGCQCLLSVALRTCLAAVFRQLTAAPCVLAGRCCVARLSWAWPINRAAVSSCHIVRTGNGIRGAAGAGPAACGVGAPGRGAVRAAARPAVPRPQGAPRWPLPASAPCTLAHAVRPTVAGSLDLRTACGTGQRPQAAMALPLLPAAGGAACA